jgi:chromosome segregation ATPase
MKSKEAEVDNVSKNLAKINEETEDLKTANAKLEKERDRTQDEYKQLCDKLEMECSKNKDFAQKLKNLENTLRSTEGELGNAVLKREALRK